MDQNKFINISERLNSVEQSIDQLEEIKRQTKREITALIETLVGLDTPLTFNDETGYPYYDDASDGLTVIVAVKVSKTEDGERKLLFNADCDQNDDYGVDQNMWFHPESYGDYDLKQLFYTLTEWNLRHNQ